METSSWLATWLDWRSLTQLGASIEPEALPPFSLPMRAGGGVADELGGRLLLRYITDAQLGTFRLGSPDACYATPTPYTPEEASRWLVLPAPQILRRHVLLLDPRRIGTIQGPQWVAMGRGIQYILPNGFPPEAIVVPGAAGSQWEVAIT